MQEAIQLSIPCGDVQMLGVVPEGDLLAGDMIAERAVGAAMREWQDMAITVANCNTFEDKSFQMRS